MLQFCGGFLIAPSGFPQAHRLNLGMPFAVIQFLPFRKLMLWATLYFGGILKHRWIGSAMTCPSNNSNPLCQHKSRSISPVFFRRLPYTTRFRYFGIETTWYLQSHRTCDIIYYSCKGSTPLTLLRGSPCGGRTYFILFHPETLEAFRAAQPKAVG